MPIARTGRSRRLKAVQPEKVPTEVGKMEDLCRCCYCCGHLLQVRAQRYGASSSFNASRSTLPFVKKKILSSVVETGGRCRMAAKLS